MVRAAGLEAGIVTNAYWATSREDALLWLRPLSECGIADFSVSDDEFHGADEHATQGDVALQAAKELGMPGAKIRIERTRVVRPEDQAGRKGKPVIGGTVLFRGRAAERLTEGLPLRRWEELTACPYEDLISPERVHIDAYGNVHLCQGLSMGNIWSTPLAELLQQYDAGQHPIAGPLIRGGPARLLKERGLPMSGSYVDECHLCYTARKSMLDTFSAHLCPKEVYGV